MAGEPDGPTSDRLRYRRIRPADLETLHRLIIDEHIKQFMMDGQAMGRDWTRDVIAASDGLFASTGVGLWFVHIRRDAEQPIGFAGFRVFDAIGPEPQLLYALLERATGHGHATEIAHALTEYALSQAGFVEVKAAVDEPNQASMRVLEKAGFRRTGDMSGAFGRTILFTRGRRPVEPALDADNPS
jgi:RimJ/RimL family protein N-acetyltransferase